MLIERLIGWALLLALLCVWSLYYRRWAAAERERARRREAEERPAREARRAAA